MLEDLKKFLFVQFKKFYYFVTDSMVRTDVIISLYCFWIFNSIRFDAELLIFLSIFLVICSVWNMLSDLLAKFLFVKVTLYYYYFVRYYQGRLWLVYLIYKFFSLYLYTKRLPYFIQWYKIYETRLVFFFSSSFELLNEKWDNLLNYYFYKIYFNIFRTLWFNVYKNYIDTYFLYTLDNNVFFGDNLRKVTEYILLNKLEF